MALGKEYLKKIKIFAECLTAGTRQRLTPVAAVTHPAIFAEGQFLPRARPSAKIYFAEGRLFAEGQALGKGFFAEGLALPRAPRASPRQRPPLPSARDLALGKPRSPRQRMSFQ